MLLIAGTAFKLPLGMSLVMPAKGFQCWSGYVACWWCSLQQDQSRHSHRSDATDKCV